MIRMTGLRKRYRGKTVTNNAVEGLDLEIADGALVTLLGPSGCGKTTTLRLIAGLERPDAGEITIDSRTMCAPARGVFVTPDRRPIGIVFQSYAIWPHMTVLQNVVFPLRVTRPHPSRRECRTRALASLELVGLADLAERPAPLLSGGQQQRVALARALIREPKVLLLDEPLSNLDAGLRDRMRDEIRALQQRLGITTVFVTHDQDEAMAISDEVVVMDSGHIVERGLPQEIYTWPRSQFTAQFLGVANEFEGTVARVSDTTVDVDLKYGRLQCHRSQSLSLGENVRVFVRPESFRLSRKYSEGAWEATVDFSIYHGDSWDYYVKVAEAPIRVRVYREKVGLSTGDTIFLTPDDAAIVIRADRSDDDPDTVDDHLRSEPVDATE